MALGPRDFPDIGSVVDPLQSLGQDRVRFGSITMVLEGWLSFILSPSIYCSTQDNFVQDLAANCWSSEDCPTFMDKLGDPWSLVTVLERFCDTKIALFIRVDFAEAFPLGRGEREMLHTKGRA